MLLGKTTFSICRLGMTPVQTRPSLLVIRSMIPLAVYALPRLSGVPLTVFLVPDESGW